MANTIFSSDSWLNQTIGLVNDALWTYVVIGVLIACALWFSFKTRFVQLRLLPNMVRLLVEGTQKDGQKHVSSFEAFAVSIAARVGTGNLAGVATAIAIGGPGAVFWMWVIAALGAATAFVESTLAQLYKRRGANSYIGGPAFYILYGLKSPRMAKAYAVVITATFAMAYNSIQSNTITSAMDQAFGVSPWLMGLVLTVLSTACVFGGISRIAKVSSVMVPLMACCYVLLALYVIIVNITLIPDVLRLIVSEAFGFHQAAGGMLGATIMTGIKRGLFSNEAGEGSAACAASIATVSHPVKQGLVQALGVFTDTLLICSCTAFIIIISGLFGSGLNGINLTQAALQAEVGSRGTIFVAVAIFFFAFSSIIGNYAYGEINIQFLTKKKSWLTFVRVMSGCVMVMFGGVASLEMVWNLGDLFMGMITLINLVAIVRLGHQAFFLLKDYQRQLREGKDPVFRKEQMPEIASELEAW